MTTGQAAGSPTPATPNCPFSGATSGARPPLLTRPLLLRFVSMVGASLSFFLLLSVVPAYAAERGGGGAAGLALAAADPR
ncbi:hypothetical protein [Streptomyces hokutonensis]|uniref:hypothetical protein n=1 Tax=Streptomyces hokutonensis TaxID=1306990 RepID=UPI0036CA6B83